MIGPEESKVSDFYNHKEKSMKELTLRIKMTTVKSRGNKICLVPFVTNFI